MLAAGFEGPDAAVMDRAIGDFSLSWASGEATFLALDKRLQDLDRSAWTRAHLAVDRADYPHTWQIRAELPDVADDHIFETILSLVMSGLAQRAPRPCECPVPGGQRTVAS
jgi:hypothetical protein